MKKLLGLFIVLFFSIHAIAGLSDPEELEFTGALNDGDLKNCPKIRRTKRSSP